MSSTKEQRIKNIVQIYYSKPEIQKAIVDFCRNREAVPSYMMESFGKRPDMLDYPGDVFELVKKGATSFHCSEELWKNPLEINTNMNEEQYNKLRQGWDLLIDIDCKWLEYSKLAADSVVKALKKSGVKNIGIKFSGSKGFHIIVPWKAFPKEVAGIKTSDMFPEWPRLIVSYLRNLSEKFLQKNLPGEFHSDFKNVEVKKGVKCRNCNEIARKYFEVSFFCDFCKSGEVKKLAEESPSKAIHCPNCRREFNIRPGKEIYECAKCGLNSIHNRNNFIVQREEIDVYELMGLDLILVSPRHLFRAPYSLHEKTALASIVLKQEDLANFDPKNADPLKVKIKNFLPDSKEGEASELLMQALDWSRQEGNGKENSSERQGGFTPIKLEKLSNDYLPPSIQKILEGVDDGKKRALFILLGLFRSIGMEKDELEKRIYDWNKKNTPPLKEGYIKAQLSWSYRNKIVPPPNFDKDYYKGIGVIPNEEELRAKNPVNYVVRKSKQYGKRGKKDPNKSKN